MLGSVNSCVKRFDPYPRRLPVKSKVLSKIALEYARQDSNLQPSVPKTDALSNCATGACAARAAKTP